MPRKSSSKSKTFSLKSLRTTRTMIKSRSNASLPKQQRSRRTNQATSTCLIQRSLTPKKRWSLVKTITSRSIACALMMLKKTSNHLLHLPRTPTKKKRKMSTTLSRDRVSTQAVPKVQREGIMLPTHQLQKMPRTIRIKRWVAGPIPQRKSRLQQPL